MFTHTIIEICSNHVNIFEYCHILNSFNVKMNISKICIFVRMLDRIVDDCVLLFVSRIKEICLLSVSLNIIIIVRRFDWIWWSDRFLRFWLSIVLNTFDQSLKNLPLLLREPSILSIVILVRHIWIGCESRFDTLCVSWGDIQRSYDAVSSSRRRRRRCSLRSFIQLIERMLEEFRSRGICNRWV